MTMNIPPRVRFALYLLSAVGSAVVAYLFTKGLVGEAESGLWAALVAVINGVAAAKTDFIERGTASSKRILGKAAMSPLDPRPTEKGRADIAYVLLVAILAVVLVVLLARVL